MSAHDFPLLLRRWQSVARKARIPLRQLPGVEDVYYLSKITPKTSHAIYLSAGIHGDEAGATEGLLLWAESRAATLASLPVIILPCLNPWGLKNNSRLDAAGRDLNRAFHNPRIRLIHALHTLLRGTRLIAALNLHEDYDAEGSYLYELKRHGASWGNEMLAIAEKIIPHDPRKKIEGSRAISGLISRKITRATFVEIGLPEAVWLWFQHTDHAFTFETPSEFCIIERAAAHAAVVEKFIQICLAAN